MDTSPIKKLMIVKIFTVWILVNHASGYIKEKNGNKSLIFDDFVTEDKALLNKISRCLGGN